MNEHVQYDTERCAISLFTSPGHAVTPSASTEHDVYFAQFVNLRNLQDVLRNLKTAHTKFANLWPKPDPGSELTLDKSRRAFCKLRRLTNRAQHIHAVKDCCCSHFSSVVIRRGYTRLRQLQLWVGNPIIRLFEQLSEHVLNTELLLGVIL